LARTHRGGALAVRLARWRGEKTFAEPLLWVLHLGYGWLSIGLLLLGLNSLTPLLPSTSALHALTVGAIGTPTDIQFVEAVDSADAFVGRTYLTILVDVFSRCILGFCLTLEAPSTLSVALCLAHAICPKEAWLELRGVTHAWPTLGRPKQIVTALAELRAIRHEWLSRPQAGRRQSPPWLLRPVEPLVWRARPQPSKLRRQSQRQKPSPS